MYSQIQRVESFLTSGWARFVGIPILLALLAGIYFALD